MQLENSECFLKCLKIVCSFSSSLTFINRNFQTLQAQTISQFTAISMHFLLFHTIFHYFSLYFNFKSNLCLTFSCRFSIFDIWNKSHSLIGCLLVSFLAFPTLFSSFYSVSFLFLLIWHLTSSLFFSSVFQITCLQCFVFFSSSCLFNLLRIRFTCFHSTFLLLRFLVSCSRFDLRIYIFHLFLGTLSYTSFMCEQEGQSAIVLYFSFLYIFFLSILCSHLHWRQLIRPSRLSP